MLQRFRKLSFVNLVINCLIVCYNRCFNNLFYIEKNQSNFNSNNLNIVELLNLIKA